METDGFWRVVLSGCQRARRPRHGKMSAPIYPPELHESARKRAAHFGETRIGSHILRKKFANRKESTIKRLHESARGFAMRDLGTIQDGGEDGTSEAV